LQLAVGKIKVADEATEMALRSCLLP